MRRSRRLWWPRRPACRRAWPSSSAVGSLSGAPPELLRARASHAWQLRFAMDNTQPIIVKRVKKVAGGHHGGAWKIAFADFATAMTAFFLVMWLMSSATPEQKKLISGYFQDPIGFTESASPMSSIWAARRRLRRTAPSIPSWSRRRARRRSTPSRPRRSPSRSSASGWSCCCRNCRTRSTRTPSCRSSRTRSSSRSPRTACASRSWMPRTDRCSPSAAPSYSLTSRTSCWRWWTPSPRCRTRSASAGTPTPSRFPGVVTSATGELSASRANAARRTLVYGGYPEEQIARVVGYASSALFDRKDPFNPVNRRIDILVLTKKAQRSIEGEQPDVSQKSDARRLSRQQAAVAVARGAQ